MKLFLIRFTFIILSGPALLSCSKDTVQPIDTPPQNPIFTGKVISDVVYANTVNWVGQKQVLGLDIYLPTPEITSAKFPLIVFFHGGGYVSGNKESTRADCEILASKGFTVATIDYRLGWTQGGTNFCLDANVPETYEAFYRAQQDARAAMRFLAASASKYSIDPNWIFVAGQSAGAGIALALTYYTQDSLDNYLPGISDTLGLLNSAGNNLKNTYDIKGIGSMWGGLLFTPDIITSANATPTIFFHGMLDQVVPWNVGHLFNCDNFPLDYGSKALYDKLVSYGTTAVAHIDPTGDHGIYDRNFDEENVACFFKGLMTSQPQTGYFTTQVPNCK